MSLGKKQAILVLSLCFSTYHLIPAFAQSDSGFINPPSWNDTSGNPTWYVGTVEQVVWYTNYSHYYIALSQLQDGGGVELSTFSEQSDGSGTLSVNWTFDPEIFDLATSNLFWFSLYPYDSNNEFSSHNFYIASGSPSSLTSSTSAPSPSSQSYTSVLPSVPVFTSTASSTATSPTNTLASPPVESQEKTGLRVGIGFGIGGAVVLGGLIVVGYMYLKQRRIRRVQATQVSNDFIRPETIIGSNLHQRVKRQHAYPSMVSELSDNPYPTTAIEEIPHQRD